MRYAFVSFLLAAGWAFSPAAAGGVYVLSDGYKVLPDGGLVELGGRGPGTLRQSSAIWSARDRTVRLAGARGEVVAFQIVIDGPAEGVAVSCAGLRGPGELGRENVSFHLVGYVRYGEAWQADVAVPLAWKGVSPLSIPCRVAGLATVPDQKVAAVLVELKIPADAKAGDYAGRVRIALGAAGGETLDVRLTVWPFALPRRPGIVFDFNSYSSPVSAVAPDNRDPYKPTPPATIAAEHEFYRCAGRHRAYLNIMPVHSQRGRGYYTPALRGKGEHVRADWTHWDRRFAGVLSGEIFDDRQPPPYFYLPHNLHWPYGYRHDPRQEARRLNFLADAAYKKDHTRLIALYPDYLKEWQAVSRQYVEHLAAKGWTRTVYQVYLNHSTGKGKSHSLSPWRLDEPYDRWGFQVLNYYARLAHRVFANDRGVKVRFRVDIGHFYCREPTMRCYKAKKYDLPLAQDGGGPELLEPVVDTWYVSTSHTFGNRRQIRRVGGLDAAKEMFAYAGGQSVTDSSTMHRSLLWYLWDFRLVGYCAWNQGCRDASRPLAKPGGDHVWYSGKGFGFAGPVPSLRMKLWRRSSYDAEYLRLAERASSRERVLGVFGKVCRYKRTHPKYKVVELPCPVNNPEDFELARLKLASIILGRDLAGSRDFRGDLDGPPNRTVEQIVNY